MAKNIEQAVELAQQVSSPSFLMPVVGALCAHMTYSSNCKNDRYDVGNVPCDMAIHQLLSDLRKACSELGVNFEEMVKIAASDSPSFHLFPSLLH